LVLQANPFTLYDSVLDQVAEEVFLSPRQKEQTEIEKRVSEKNREEISKIRTTLKFNLQNEQTQSKIKAGNLASKQKFIRLLEDTANLGGILWYAEDQIFYSWGDWSDFYEDGLSVSKIRKEGQLPTFQQGGDKFYFYVKNSSGYFPVDFQFLGWESTFYAFGDDGSLRYTNDFLMDHAMRTSEFRKIFEAIKRKITHCESIVVGDLNVFIVPGNAHPLYFVLFGLRVFIYLWAIYLFYLFLSATFPFLKKHLPKESPLPK
jgi:hypothetical protein